MDERIKQRLVGAVVLVSLVVIFVPMLLENEPVLERGITQSNIPSPPPELEQFRPGVLPAPPVQSLPAREQAQSAVAATAAPVSVTMGMEPEPEPEPEPGSAEPAPAPELPVAPLTAVQPTRPAQVSRPSPPPAAAAAPGERSGSPPKPRVGVSAWVVQLGSFARRENADSLAQRLRQEHHEAFVEPIEIGSTLWFRVRVGPELDRKRAEEMLAGVRKTLGAEAQGAQVVRYP